MATQTCSACGFSSWDDGTYTKHVDDAPQSCFTFLRTENARLQARADVSQTLLNNMEERYAKMIGEIVVRQSQLLNPKAAKEIETFVKEPSRY